LRKRAKTEAELQKNAEKAAASLAKKEVKRLQALKVVEKKSVTMRTPAEDATSKTR
jgi:hypothetical protein